MTTIWLDKKPQFIKEVCNLNDFLMQHCSEVSAFAVMVNQKFIPRTDYQKIMLKDGDQIDIVEPMQGG